MGIWQYGNDLSYLNYGYEEVIQRSQDNRVSCVTVISQSGNAAYSKSKHGASAAVEMLLGIPALTCLQGMQVRCEGWKE